MRRVAARRAAALPRGPARLRAAAWAIRLPGGALALALLMAPGLAAACRHRPAPPGPDVAARIGGGEIRYSEFQEYLSHTMGDADTLVASDVQSQLFDQFLEERLLLQLALDRRLVGAGSLPRQAIDALLRQAGATPPGAQEIEAYYDRHREEFSRPERVRLRQILTEDRRTALAAQQAIARGEDFAAVARRLSHDASASAGGYQGELARSDLPPAFVDIIFALRPGEVSRLVPAGYGFHLFQVVERLPAEVVALAGARGEIADRLRRQQADRTLAALVRQARGDYNPRVYERNLPFDYEGSYSESHPHDPARTDRPARPAPPPAR